MTDAVGPSQTLHVALLKDVADQAVAFAQLKFRTVTGHDPRRILTSVLEHRQRIIEFVIDVLMTDYSNDAAHNSDFKPRSVLR
jgi:hypothetical protein